MSYHLNGRFLSSLTFENVVFALQRCFWCCCVLALVLQVGVFAILRVLVVSCPSCLGGVLGQLTDQYRYLDNKKVQKQRLGYTYSTQFRPKIRVFLQGNTVCRFIHALPVLVTHVKNTRKYVLSLGNYQSGERERSAVNNGTTFVYVGSHRVHHLDTKP